MAGKKDIKPIQMAAMVSAMGFEIFAFIIIGALIGKYLDGHFGFSHLWLPICAVAGFFFGLFSCYYTLKSFMKD
ncbi:MULTISPECIES: AtpZ/AtpI family protein [unclassified Sporolactobacillus]|uniref:AtpZ/AtpI family protein n=1 Tax=unclassified Sporolactobacillus TaxID=2628533 RepID=UPI002368E850|nr:AtpZ/AtpI family protein [Sporolactobacillus sp. CQH2019]MDD9148261.1 AtpZ/AtpI family protein [Sporolactobacillus sp. CQH2019]